MSLTRRDTLRIGGTIGLTGLAGCTSVGVFGPVPLGLTLLNWHDLEHLLRVRLFRPDADNRDNAVAFDEEFRLSPHGDGGPTVIEVPEVAENRRYLVRAAIQGNTGDAIRHHHFIPPDPAEAPDNKPRLHVEIREGSDGAPRLDIF